jgi:hypothetical protein
MTIMSAQELKVYALGSRRIVYAPAGRGEDVRLHLASHGIVSELAHRDPFGRLELERFADAQTVQAVLDDWERSVTAVQGSQAGILHPQQPDRRFP